MGTHPIFESDFDCLTDSKKKNEKMMIKLAFLCSTVLAWTPDVSGNCKQRPLECFRDYFSVAMPANRPKMIKRVINDDEAALLELLLSGGDGENAGYATPNDFLNH